jgi:ABC-type Mn2+/Zn2+ transport system ATPase subunit
VEKSLIITLQGTEIFSSSSKWLYPLFEFEDFLTAKRYNPEELLLTDKIAGKAAAFLIVRLGIKKAHIHLISEGALSVFNRFGIQITYDQMVPRIVCKTEEIVKDSDNVDTVWQMLRRRAGRVNGLAIDVKNIRVDVEGRTVLENLSLIVGKGDHIFIKGANGAGKTTLLKAILGLEKLQSGSIKIGDFEVGTPEWNKNRMVTGYVHQEMVKNTFPITAAEVVSIGMATSKSASEEITHRVEIAMRRTGCFHLASRSYHQLSGGEKQRVNIARCLCQQSKVLLFDEPTSFLDQTAKSDLFELLTGLWENEAPTAIIVSHDNTWIDRFGCKVYELKDGVIC